MKRLQQGVQLEGAICSILIKTAEKLRQERKIIF